MELVIGYNYFKDMYIVPIIILSIGALMLFWFLYEKIKAYSIKEVCLKATTSVLFISLCVYSMSQTGLKTFPYFAVMALVCGLLGDIALDLKYVYKEKDFEYTLAGFIAFSVGHILYVTGMFLEFYHGQSVLYIIIPLGIGLLMGPITMLVGKLSNCVYGRIKPVAFIYAVILFSMVSTGFSLWMMSGFANTGLLMMFIGGVLFAVSDLILNLTYFAEGHEQPFDLISNAVTYYGAQFIIAFSILFM